MAPARNIWPTEMPDSAPTMIIGTLGGIIGPTVDEAAVMVIDGQGSPVSDFTEHWSGAASTPGDWREVSSFYSASRKEIRCIGKQVRPPDGARHVDGRLVGLGMFYFLLTQAIFPGEGNEGKVMGLARPRLAGRADMGAVSARVRARLAG